MSKLRSKVKVAPVQEKIPEEVKKFFKTDWKILFETFGDRYDGFYEQLRYLIDNKYLSDVQGFLLINKEKEEMVEFQFEAFDKPKSDEKIKLDEMEHTEDVRGVKCATCGSGFTGSESRQFRSLDEGATTRFFCSNCANKAK